MGKDGEGASKRPLSPESEANRESTDPKKLKSKDFAVLINFDVAEFKDLNPVRVTNWIKNLVGEDCEVSPFKVKKAVKVVTNQKGVEVLMKQQKFDKIKIRVERFAQEVFVKGIIHGVELDITDDELLQGLHCPDASASKFRVSEVFRFKGVAGRSKSVVLKFPGSELPEVMVYGWTRFRVSLFIPRPLRCFRCQRFGHSSQVCRSVQRCSTCGGNHSYENCTEDIKCVNCGGSHSAASKECPKFVELQNVMKIKTEGKMTFAEAVKCAEAQKAQKAVSEKARTQGSQISRMSQNTLSNSQSFSQVVSSQQFQGGVSGELSGQEHMEVQSVLDSEGLLRADSPTLALGRVPDWESLVLVMYKMVALASERKLFSDGRRKVFGKIVEMINTVVPQANLDEARLVDQLDFDNVPARVGGYVPQ